MQVKVYDNDGKLIREGSARADEVKVGNGVVIRYELMGVIAMMIIQSLTAVWWASGISTNVRFMADEMKELKSSIAAGAIDRYTSAEASKDREVMSDRINSLEKRMQSIVDNGTPGADRRLSVLEYKLGIERNDRYEKK